MKTQVKQGMPGEVAELRERIEEWRRTRASVGLMPQELWEGAVEAGRKCYDGRGFWLCQRRLSAGRFRWWPGDEGEGTANLEAFELQVLLAGGDPSQAGPAPMWRRVCTSG